eukprot:1158652-Pelagomonas_calceolata.AAC.5
MSIVVPLTISGHHGFAHSCTSAGGGGAGGPWHRSYDGKPPPAEFQSPEFVTYAGLTLPKPKQDWDYWSSKAMGAVLWFTLFYHFALNWEEHWVSGCTERARLDPDVLLELAFCNAL